jgi:hypothetical protein
VAYAELKSTQKVAVKVDKSARTVYLQIGKHNTDIGKFGECLHCKHAKNGFDKDIINIPKRNKKEG